MKVGVLTALGITIQNFPEGFATFAGTLYSLDLGILLAIAIAIHNIPEGLTVYLPIFSTTGNRRKAFMYSFVSGIFEPIGAIVGAFFLLLFLTDYILQPYSPLLQGLWFM